MYSKYIKRWSDKVQSENKKIIEWLKTRTWRITIIFACTTAILLSLVVFWFDSSFPFFYFFVSSTLYVYVSGRWLMSEVGGYHIQFSIGLSIVSISLYATASYLPWESDSAESLEELLSMVFAALLLLVVAFSLLVAAVWLKEEKMHTIYNAFKNFYVPIFVFLGIWIGLDVCWASGALLIPAVVTLGIYVITFVAIFVRELILYPIYEFVRLDW